MPSRMKKINSPTSENHKVQFPGHIGKITEKQKVSTKATKDYPKKVRDPPPPPPKPPKGGRSASAGSDGEVTMPQERGLNTLNLHKTGCLIAKVTEKATKKNRLLTSGYANPRKA